LRARRILPLTCKVPLAVLPVRRAPPLIRDFLPDLTLPLLSLVYARIALSSARNSLLASLSFLSFLFLSLPLPALLMPVQALLPTSYSLSILSLLIKSRADLY